MTCWAALFPRSSREDGGESDHAWRNGEGTTGAVGFAGVRSRAADEVVEGRGADPLTFGVEGEVVVGKGREDIDGSEVKAADSPVFRRL